MPQVIGFPEKDETPWSTTEDRRASVRHPAKLRIQCGLVTNAADPPIWTTQVSNVSAFGVGLILPKAPGLGQLLEIELARKNGTLVRTVLARVVHNARESSKAFLAGCAFIKELNDQHLRLFQAGTFHLSGPDCRRWIRFPCNVETAFYSCDTAPGENRSGRIVNISAGGIGLTLHCEFSKGTLLHCELPLELNLASPNTLVRVVRVTRQRNGNWFLGCEFADQLSEEQLRALLR